MANDSIEYDLIDEEAYRDSIATVDKNGKRIWLYPKKPKGAFYNKRIIATVVFLLIFVAIPLIRIGGQPFLMMNIFERKFVIFGQLFLPQDFVFFGLGMITFVLFIALFTVTYGRLWCGWFCPQTVFMEMIFRPIEYWLEGDARQQQKFDQAAWDFNKLWRKGLKHLIYIVFSIFISHVTMAYLIGTDGVIDVVTHSPSEHLSGFIGLVVFTVLFYFVFARLREQVCIAICPYGRLQGVLVNRDTMTIIYDYLRGEPRGRASKTKNEQEVTAKKGDCIDCKLCVQVCPTGIDIRNGIQLECVNCTACIDVCDEVMDKIEKPRGLIRYASVDTIEKNKPFKFGKRTYAYSAVLAILIAVEIFFLVTRSAVETTIMRVPGQLYQENEKAGTITNLYNAQMVNKSDEAIDITVKVKNNDAIVKFADGAKVIHVGPTERRDVVFFLEMKNEQVKSRKTELVVEIYNKNELMESVKTNFLGPNL